jgi:hypothetical protein
LYKFSEVNLYNAIGEEVIINKVKATSFLSWEEIRMKIISDYWFVVPPGTFGG